MVIRFRFHLPLILSLAIFITGCKENAPSEIPQQTDTLAQDIEQVQAIVEPIIIPPIIPQDIILTKDFLYDEYKLKDTYPYLKKTRSFKWDVIRTTLAQIENAENDTAIWVVLQNYKNLNTMPPLVRKYIYNKSQRVADTLGVPRNQAVPLYLMTDTIVPERYAYDGSLALLKGQEGQFSIIQPMLSDNLWKTPSRYLKKLGQTVAFHHVIFIDRLDQNITALERIDHAQWKIRSMNPATTGLDAPPYGQETPLGIFLLQQKKEKMNFLKDGSNDIAGYAPYASRFSGGAHIHGVPVNLPRTEIIEYSWTLGTTPRSHMCVRNATSHAKFIYDWAPTWRTLIVVIE